jgi:hypothetical protein
VRLLPRVWDALPGQATVSALPGQALLAAQAGLAAWQLQQSAHAEMARTVGAGLVGRNGQVAGTLLVPALMKLFKLKAMLA